MTEVAETPPFLRSVVVQTLWDLDASRYNAEQRITTKQAELERERVQLEVTLKRIDELHDWLAANPS